MFNLWRRKLLLCYKKAKNSAYNKTVRLHQENASACWNPLTKRSIDILDAAQRRAAKFVLGCYDNSPTADLTGILHLSSQWDT